MEIVKLIAENVKRLKVVQIEPDGRIVQITGRNAQGKTSVLDSIEMAMAGSSSIPPVPVRTGEASARVVVDLGEIVVKRTWNARGDSYLKVESSAGIPVSSPQTVLDKLTGSLTFDPLAFVKAKPNEQVAILKKVIGIDFTSLDADQDKAYQERREINREVKTLEARLSGIPDVDAPDEEVPLSLLVGALESAKQTNAENDKRRKSPTLLRIKADQERESHGKSAKTIESLISQNDKEMEYLRERIAQLERTNYDYGAQLSTEIASMNAMIADLEAQADEESKAAASLVDEDIAVLQQQINDSESTNAKVRKKKAREEIVAELRKAKDASDALTAHMDKIDGIKARSLAKAKWPVPGMGFDVNGPTLNGLPFSQASGAEKLGTSVAMAVAMNPKLRVMLIRDGSLLDAENLALLGQLAEEHDAQIWIERVAGDEPVGIVIEDGEVKKG
jgi:hypothetical protein